MKTNPIRIARAAANAADMASVAAAAAENLLMEDPTAWELADNAYWMLKAAVKTAEAAADALDAEAAEDNPAIMPPIRPPIWKRWPKRRATKSAAEKERENHGTGL